jgi:D-alanyl-lipoteichoic acid acyltransferase DltB (MBOAT superfamily)
LLYWRQIGSVLIVAANAAAVLLACGNARAALLYCIAAFILVRAPSVVGQDKRAAVRALAVFVATGMTLLFRGPQVPVVPGGGLAPAAQPVLEELARLQLRFVGVSYSFLRLVSAILEDRRWSVWDFARYFLFLPTFVSGPIVEPRDFLTQSGGVKRELVREGVSRIVLGIVRLAGAVLLGNAAILATSEQFRWALGDATPPLLWLGFFISGLWLYLDFSGFSDLYIGTALLLGYRVPENFARPYAASDITAFWQSWHISLGAWLRARIYNPLGRRYLAQGKNSAPAAGAALPIVTMVACGAWHGLTAAFLCWGLLHGVALGAHYLWRLWSASALPPRVRTHPLYHGAAWLSTQAFVTATWVFFLPVGSSVSLSDRLAMIALGLGL